MSLRLASVASLTGLAALVVAPAVASADRRAFTHTYEYMTMPEGQTELEIYTEQGRSTWDDDALQTAKIQLEIEHGITERWDVSLYHVFEQASGGPATARVDEPLRLTEIKLRSRYRFAERGELPVDVALYGEVVKAFGASVYELEFKPIVARDVGLVTIAAQPVIALELGGDVEEPELEVGWAAGVTYEVAPELKVGAETWGAFKEEFEEQEAYVGPALSWAPAQSFWVALTPGFGFADAERFNVRAILGMDL